MESIKTINDLLEYNKKHAVHHNRDVGTFFNFKRDLGTWLGGLVGSIPIVGAMAAAWFNIGYTHFFMDSEGQVYVPISVFQDMLSEFRKEMEALLDKKLDEMYVDLSNKAFITLQSSCNEYNTRVAAYEKKFGSGRSMSSMDEKNIPNYLKMKISDEKLMSSDEDALKEMIRTQYSIVINEMERCFVLFTQGNQEQNKLLTGNLITTLLFYVLIQRDVHFKGREFGFPSDYISRMKSMIHTKIVEIMTHICIKNGMPFSGSDISKENSPDLYNIYKQFSYLDIEQFPIGSKKFEINTSTYTATIPTEYNNGEDYTYIIDNGKSKFTDKSSQNPIEPCYGCEQFTCSSFEFKVSRPSKSFTSAVIYIHTSIEIDPNNPGTTFLVDGTKREPQREKVYDEANFINFPITDYAKLNVTFSTAKTDFTVKVSYKETGFPFIYSCHSKIILK